MLGLGGVFFTFALADVRQMFNTEMPVSLSGYWQVPMAEAAQGCSTQNPKAPTTGNGGLYYNVACDTFRFYTTTNQWQDMSYWYGSAGRVFAKDTSYNVGIGTISPSQKLEVSGGRLRIDTSALSISASDLSSRNVLHVNVPTGSSNNLAAFVAENVDQFGLWSNKKKSNAGDWADLTVGSVISAGNIYTKFIYTCNDPLNFATTGTCRLLDSGTTWWSDSFPTTGSTSVPLIRNQNLANPEYPLGGGDVVVTRDLTVNRSLAVTSSAISYSTWNDNVLTVTQPLVFKQTNGDINTPYKMEALSTSPEIKIIVGENGAGIHSETNGTWAAITPDPSVITGSITSVWAKNVSTIYATGSGTASPTHSPVLRYQNGSWTPLTLEALDLAVGDFVGGSSYVWGDGSYLYISVSHRSAKNRFFRYNIDSSNGNLSGKYTILLNQSITPVRNIQGSIDNTVWATDANAVAYYNSSTGDDRSVAFTDLLPGFTAKKIAVAYEKSACATCVALIGSSNNIPKFYFLSLKSANSSPYFDTSPLVPQLNGVFYNTANYSFEDVWVSQGGTTVTLDVLDKANNRHILLMFDKTNIAAPWQNVTPPTCPIIIPATNPTDPPLESYSNCTTSPSDPYLLGGGIQEQYAVQQYSSITNAQLARQVHNNGGVFVFQKGLSTEGGSLSVAGRITGQNDLALSANLWGGSGLTSFLPNGTVPASGGTTNEAVRADEAGEILISGANRYFICPRGEYVIGIRSGSPVSATGGFGITHVICSKL